MSEKKTFKCSKCGSGQFFGNLRMHVVVVVDGENNFIRHHKEAEESYENEEPHGPYECCECGALYNEIGN